MPSTLETVVSWQTYIGSASLIGGKQLQRPGSAHQSVAPYQSFLASDGYFNLAVGNDTLWPRFCDILDSVYDGERWYRAAEYDTNNKRVQARDKLIARLAPIFRTRPRSFWLDLFQQAGIPAGNVDSIEEVAHNPQLLARHMFEHVEHPTLSKIPTVRTLITFSNMSLALSIAPPQLGADTQRILQELGYSEAHCAVRDLTKK